jgi:hypothetical protein
MGATAVRSHTLGISVGCSLVEPALGKFNQVALQHIDYAIESARDHPIKLIIPLTDNWHYYHGGKHTLLMPMLCGDCLCLPRLPLEHLLLRL